MFCCAHDVAFTLPSEFVSHSYIEPSTATSMKYGYMSMKLQTGGCHTDGWFSRSSIRRLIGILR